MYHFPQMQFIKRIYICKQNILAFIWLGDMEVQEGEWEFSRFMQTVAVIQNYFNFPQYCSPPSCKIFEPEHFPKKLKKNFFFLV